MDESDPKYLRDGQWVRRNGQTAVGMIIDREGACLILNAPDTRAVPFKVPERLVTVLDRHGNPLVTG